MSILDAELFPVTELNTYEERPLLSLGMNQPVHGYALKAEAILPGSQAIEGQFFCLPQFRMQISVPIHTLPP